MLRWRILHASHRVAALNAGTQGLGCGAAGAPRMRISSSPGSQWTGSGSRHRILPQRRSRRRQQMCQCWDPGNEDSENATSSSFLGMLLEKAIVSFISSQLDRHSGLKVSIAGKNSEILRGNLRTLQVHANKVVYRGISMSNVQLTASAVRFRFRTRRILRQPIRVNAAVCFKEEDIASSIRSPLVSVTLSELLEQRESPLDLSPSLDKGLLYLKGKPCEEDPSDRALFKFSFPKPSPRALALEFGLRDNGQMLVINSVQINSRGQRASKEILERKYALGQRVRLKKLEVLKSEMHVVGDFIVSP